MSDTDIVGTGISFDDVLKALIKVALEGKDLLTENKRLRKAYEVMGDALRENGTDYCDHCLRVYYDTSDEVLYRHREGRCLT